MTGEFSEAPNPEAPKAAKQELAVGLDKDPRLETIKRDLINDWEQSHGVKIVTTEEGQAYVFGDRTAWTRGEEPITLNRRAEKIFADRFPDDAQEYAKRELKRAYENPNDDPAIQATEANITRITNQDITEIQNRKWGVLAAREARLEGFGTVWNRNFNRVSDRFWDDFLSTYPEKAAAYREKHPPVGRAFEARERLERYHQQQGVDNKQG